MAHVLAVSQMRATVLYQKSGQLGPEVYSPHHLGIPSVLYATGHAYHISNFLTSRGPLSLLLVT